MQYFCSNPTVPEKSPCERRRHPAKGLMLYQRVVLTHIVERDAQQSPCCRGVPSKRCRRNNKSVSPCRCVFLPILFDPPSVEMRVRSSYLRVAVVSSRAGHIHDSPPSHAIRRIESTVPSCAILTVVCPMISSDAHPKSVRSSRCARKRLNRVQFLPHW